MFDKITPEEAGISSKQITEFISKINKRGASTHGLLFMKGDKIFAEAYWAPFNKDFCHRMYSVTKSFVSLAIGLLLEEGKLTLDDTIASHFPKKIKIELTDYFKKLTIRDMLMMKTCGKSVPWYTEGVNDRTSVYFNYDRPNHPSGTLWAYDSSGSQVLCSLVEKLSGMPLLDYLKKKIFNEMDAFQTAKVLKMLNGNSWGDSALIATQRDMAKVGRLLLNKGVWNGKRLMGEEYIEEATSKLADNQESAYYGATHQGYGYQFWRVAGNGFAMVGMGDQYTICYPDKDLVVVITSGNVGNPLTREMLITYLEDMIVDKISDTPIAQDKASADELDMLISNLKLRHISGEQDSPFRKELDGRVYLCESNPMGIKRFSFVFKDKTEGEFRYENEQGEKVIPFGVNHNVFGKFPQYGYPYDRCGEVTTNGLLYDDAVSFAWLEEKKIMIFVQVIDRFFGNATMLFSFKDDEVLARFTNIAEGFMQEYSGDMLAKRVEK